MRNSASTPAYTKRGFTLTELLAVLCVMSIVTAFTVPAFNNVIRELNLVNGGSMIVDELDFAWQTAISKDKTVEVRFYQNKTSLNYDTVVSLIPADPNVSNSKIHWLGKPNSLPNNVIFDISNPTFSPLITATVGSSPSLAISDTTDPYTLQGRQYVYFRFRPNGSTDLDGGALTSVPPAWCLTLRNENGSKGLDGTPASNFVTILLDPVLGRTRVFQPH